MSAVAVADKVIEHNGHIIRGTLQQGVFRMIKRRPSQGYTAAEIEDYTGLDHGKISGALSVLHKRGVLALLKEKRDGFMIYVLSENVKGRPTKARKS